MLTTGPTRICKIQDLHDTWDHLLVCLREKYPVKVDWDAQQYIGINLTLNYKEGEVLLCMKYYVTQALKQFKHQAPNQFHYGPSRMEPITYWTKVQYSPTIDDRRISDEAHKFIQQITGKFLFYARAVDPTMLHALNCIACGGAAQANLEATKYFLNYAACNPDAQII